MKDGVLIGIDAGTSVIKSVAFSGQGEQLGVAALPNAYETLPGGGAEQDMARTWKDAAKTLRLLADQVPDLNRRTLGVAVTGQGDGTWLIDDAGEPAAPAWIWLDSRAAGIAEEFAAHPGYPEHYRRTGTGVNGCQQSVQLVWMKRHRPEALERAASAHRCKDWLYFKLTGERVTDPSEAVFTYGDVATRGYAPVVFDALDAADLKRLLPPIVDGTLKAGVVSSEAAEATGLAAGTPVNLGYVDVMCTGLGGGLYDPQGRVGCTIAGSTGMHMRIAPNAEAVKFNAEMSGYTMAFPAPGMYAQMQSNMASTINIDWLLDLALGVLAEQGVARSRADLLQGMDARILERPAARLLYHPYISTAGERGPFLEPAARAMFTGLETGMGYADLMRAVFEGLCFAARDCYAAMGGVPEEVRVTGGAARSKALRLMLASTLQVPVRTVDRDEAGAAGAAMMAAVQQKLYPDMGTCAAKWVTPLIGEAAMPDAALALAYDAAFEQYRETRERMRPVWRRMYEVRHGR